MFEMYNFRGTPVVEIDNLDELEESFTLAEQFVKILDNSDPGSEVRQKLFDEFGKQSFNIETEHILMEIFFDFSVCFQIKKIDTIIIIQNIAEENMLKRLTTYLEESDFILSQTEINEISDKINKKIDTIIIIQNIDEENMLKGLTTYLEESDFILSQAEITEISDKINNIIKNCRKI